MTVADAPVPVPYPDHVCFPFPLLAADEAVDLPRGDLTVQVACLPVVCWGGGPAPMP